LRMANPWISLKPISSSTMLQTDKNT
jgi:hypothetical protein